MNNIVAIDPGTSHTGVCVFDGKVTRTYTVQAEGVYGFAKTQTMADKVCAFVKVGDTVVMEDYGYGGAFFNAQVAELVGLLKSSFYCRKTGLMMTVAPNTMKKVVSGSGRATKPEVKSALVQLSKLYKVSFTTKHESDSFGLMVVYMKYVAEALEEETMRALKGRIKDFSK